jgi:hypothetical protein
MEKFRDHSPPENVSHPSGSINGLRLLSRVDLPAPGFPVIAMLAYFNDLADWGFTELFIEGSIYQL